MSVDLREVEEEMEKWNRMEWRPGGERRDVEATVVQPAEPPAASCALLSAECFLFLVTQDQEPFFFFSGSFSHFIFFVFFLSLLFFLASSSSPDVDLKSLKLFSFSSDVPRVLFLFHSLLF